ncbi:hypothetical protein [Curtobacterium sp. MCJR17_043]|uniref:hypothetical protein n=1 Tax=Curtobacterium sp. MCJR17_043 TaxID=2175660 RepID=UPI0024DFFDB0|nr:hypothetical protein [Curtobacterium sp. MCJR17_043]WIB36311.1 hypothetical protein DEJ15_03850 [Curtobacterium sp. MCJR17_043]
MLRSRIAAAAVGATVLGVTAGLVPSVSGATSFAALPPVVTWADGADDFARLAPESTDLSLPDGWSWFGGAIESGDAARSLDDVVDFGQDGLTVHDDSSVFLLHPTTRPVVPELLQSVVADATAATGDNALVGLIVADESDPDVLATTAFALEGLHGADTTWAYTDSGEETTSELAADLASDHRVVTGYFVALIGSDILSIDPGTVEPGTEEPGTEEPGTEAPGTEPTDAPTTAPTDAPTHRRQRRRTPPTSAPTAPTTPLDDTLRRLLPQVTEGAAAEGAAAFRATADADAAAAAAADAHIASLRFDDTTTYFTPQPTATATVADPELTVAEATSTGFAVSGSGFAPGERISVSLTVSETGAVFPVGPVADADGAFTATVVLPAGTVAGPGNLELLGTASGQVAAPGIRITDGAVAPVATPVPGRATFTG